MVLGMSGVVFFIWLVIAIVSAYFTFTIAENKGYDSAWFVVLGLVLPILGLVAVLAMPYKKDSNNSHSGELSKASAIAEYKKLLDDGAITQQEFDSAKARIFNGEAPATTKETPRAKRDNGSVRVYIKYHMNDVATATIEDGDERRIYHENRKNDTGMSHRDFCAMFAEEIERDIGRDVKWSMEDVS